LIRREGRSAGGEILGEPDDKALGSFGKNVFEGEPSVEHSGFVRFQLSFRRLEQAEQQRSLGRIARIGSQEAHRHGETLISDAADLRQQTDGDRGKRLSGFGGVVFRWTALQARAEEPRQVSRDRSKAAVGMSLPSAFGANLSSERLKKVSDSPLPISQSRPTPPDGGIGQAEERQRRDDPASTLKQPTAEDRPQEKEQIQVRADPNALEKARQ
jgi:hypothetical protein